MADKRIIQLTNEITNPHDYDVLAIDKGDGSTSANYTFKFKLGSLFAMIANRTMTMLNKTLVTPFLSGGFTTDSTTLVTGLNADRVDGCHVGPSAGNIALWGTAGQNLDLAFLEQIEATYLRSGRGLSGVNRTHASGTLNLTSSMLGVVFVDATAACTLNLPTGTAANAGASILIAHRTGTYSVTVTATGSQVITDYKDSLTFKEQASVGLTTVGASILLTYDGNGHWLVTGGRGFTGLE
jgi:hypothetical protein